MEKNEVPLLLRAAKETPMFTLVFMALNTGMRRGELLGLRWSDIDLDLSFLNVRQTLQFTRANGIEFKEPKTDSSKREITLPSIAVEVLRTRKAAQLRERLMLGLGKDETALVFTREDQQPIAPYNITKAFNRLVKKAGIQKITFHGLRHTHISHLLADGIDIKTVSERAGHSSASITLDVYSHVLEKTQELAAQTVDVAMRAALED